MKKFFNLLALSLVLFMAYGCSDDNDPITYERIVLNGTNASGVGLNQTTDWPNNLPSWPVWRPIHSRTLIPNTGGTFHFTGVVDANKGSNASVEKITITSITLYGTQTTWTADNADGKSAKLEDVGIASLNRAGDNAYDITFLPNNTDGVRQILVSYEGTGLSGQYKDVKFSWSSSCDCMVFNKGTLVDSFYEGAATAQEVFKWVDTLNLQ